MYCRLTSAETPTTSSLVCCRGLQVSPLELPTSAAGFLATNHLIKQLSDAGDEGMFSWHQSQSSLHLAHPCLKGRKYEPISLFLLLSLQAKPGIQPQLQTHHKHLNISCCFRVWIQRKLSPMSVVGGCRDPMLLTPSTRPSLSLFMMQSLRPTSRAWPPEVKIECLPAIRRECLIAGLRFTRLR